MIGECIQSPHGEHCRHVVTRPEKEHGGHVKWSTSPAVPSVELVCCWCGHQDDERRDVYSELERRITALEHRVAALEAR